MKISQHLYKIKWRFRLINKATNHGHCIYFSFLFYSFEVSLISVASFAQTGALGNSLTNLLFPTYCHNKHTQKNLRFCYSIIFSKLINWSRNSETQHIYPRSIFLHSWNFSVPPSSSLRFFFFFVQTLPYLLRKSKGSTHTRPLVPLRGHILKDIPHFALKNKNSENRLTISWLGRVRQNCNCFGLVLGPT